MNIFFDESFEKSIKKIQDKSIISKTAFNHSTDRSC
jgi:hypothetical protein